MLCPIYHAETLTKYPGEEEKQIVSAKFLPCIENRCAWWNGEKKKCAIVVIAEGNHV